MGRVATGTEFWAAARAQRACAGCGVITGGWDAHHVVERQELKRRHEPQFDARNALRLCNERAPGENCHGAHTSAMRRVKLTDLRVENLDYAFEILGPFAHDYLARRYAGEDSRLKSRLA